VASKETKKKQTEQQNLIKMIITLAVIIILITLIVLLHYNEKDYYKIEPRIDKVKTVEIEKGKDFDTIGWLRVQGTNMDMPIIQSPSRSEIFPANLDNFVWSLNKDSKYHNFIFIMGHNYFNLSSTPKITSKTFTRFEELMAFVYYDFAKKNKYIQLTMDDKEYLYKIFSVGFIKTFESLEMTNYGDLNKEEMKDYLELLEENNLYDYDVDVNENDNIITLATCTRFFGANPNYEFFVNGRLVREKEKINNYSVKKNKNYKKIEKKLKGDGDNEDDNL